VSNLNARCFVRRGKTLVPADIHADDFLSNIKEGKEIMVSVSVPRSPQHHRWFFAMLNRVCESVDGWNDEEELLDAIKIAVGHVESRQTLYGAVYRKPKSIAWDRMGEDKFKRFVQRALYVLNIQFGIDGEALMEEIDKEQEMSIGTIRKEKVA
tara:strand:+ start:1439 stop:1900 length:462 start_codon:yes stop_codon:yes gene_type:complete